MAAYNLAVELDRGLGRAYAGLAAMDANIGKRQEAEKNYQAALSRIDRMTDREKYRTRSGYYLLMRNQPKAIEELTALVKQYPSDTAGHANLALAYFYQRGMTKAPQEQKRAIQITPQNVDARSNHFHYPPHTWDRDVGEQSEHT